MYHAAGAPGDSEENTQASSSEQACGTQLGGVLDAPNEIVPGATFAPEPNSNDITIQCRGPVQSEPSPELHSCVKAGILNRLVIIE